ncbi:plasminogen receptor (KT) [Pimephales promelas]|nr:plasminogen receptor (KT) [Pimephales promelas]
MSCETVCASVTWRQMGFLLSKSMDQSLQKQQEFMLISGRMQMERQMLMQNEMRERQTAMQIAWSREFLKYFSSFYGLTALGLIVGAVRQRRAVLLAPVVPLSFILAYQMDMAYGSLIHRMRAEAESIMVSESERLDLPHGLPTFESIEKSRRSRAHLTSLLEK